MEAFNTDKRIERVKLIFNPGSGANKASPAQLMDITKELQAWRFIPETFLVKPDCALPEAIQEAAAQGIRTFVVSGGDGTVSSAARELAKVKNAVMGIIPTGTQNNIAFSLGIPTDIPSAVSLLRTGRHIKTDIGFIECKGAAMPFLEMCSVGLFSAVFPAGDDIQHGNFLRIGDFLAALVNSPPAQISLLIDDNDEINVSGHTVLISNMPYIMRHYQTGSAEAYKDGLLDILIYAGMSKLDLMGHALKQTGSVFPDDPRIIHFLARKVVIETAPAMPVMADGMTLGEGRASIRLQKAALTVTVPRKKGEKIERKTN